MRSSKQSRPIIAGKGGSGFTELSRSLRAHAGRSTKVQSPVLCYSSLRLSCSSLCLSMRAQVAALSSACVGLIGNGSLSASDHSGMLSTPTLGDEAHEKDSELSRDARVALVSAQAATFEAEELYQRRVLTITGICVALLVVGIVCVVAYCKTKKQRQKMQNHLHQGQNQCVEQPNRTLANGPNHPGPGPEEIPMVDVSPTHRTGGQRSSTHTTPGVRGHHHPPHRGSEVTQHRREHPTNPNTPEGSTPGVRGHQHARGLNTRGQRSSTRQRAQHQGSEVINTPEGSTPGVRGHQHARGLNTRGQRSSTRQRAQHQGSEVINTPEGSTPGDRSD
ncbi:unnamed protein product [Boreogadus saida]